MIRYVAFLRGINVGGNKQVNMQELKKLFESIGFEKVATYIEAIDKFNFYIATTIFELDFSLFLIIA